MGSFSQITSNWFGPVAQLVERSTENRKVTGSTPVGTTEPSRSFYIAGVLFIVRCCARRCLAARFDGRHNLSANRCHPCGVLDLRPHRNCPGSTGGASLTLGTASPPDRRSLWCLSRYAHLAPCSMFLNPAVGAGLSSSTSASKVLGVICGALLCPSGLVAHRRG